MNAVRVSNVSKPYWQRISEADRDEPYDTPLTYEETYTDA